MENRYKKTRILTLICGLASWGLCLLAALLMGYFPLWLADVLTVLWVGTSLGAVIPAIILRFLVGARKDLLLRWAMIFGSVMAFIQVLVFGLMYFQQNFEWEISSVGLVSFAAALGVFTLFLLLYVCAARRGQVRIENTPVPDEERKGRSFE